MASNRRMFSVQWIDQRKNETKERTRERHIKAYDAIVNPQITDESALREVFKLIDKDELYEAIESWLYRSIRK